MRLPLASLALLAVAAGCGGAPTDGTSSPTAAREAAPAFSLASLGGETVSLSGLAGKVVVLSFWDTH